MEHNTGEHQVFRTTIDRSGRVTIPAEARLRKRLKAGDAVLLEEDGDEVRLRTIDDVVRKAQAYFKSFVPDGVSLVDELIAERRAEAKAGSRGE